MKSTKLVISDVAVADLTDIWLYIAEGNPENADRFISKIHEKCLMLAQSPHIGRQRDELARGIRSFPIKRFLIFYRINEDMVEIVRVLSGYRDIEQLF